MASEGPGVLRKLGVAVLNATLMLAALVLLLAVLLVWQVRGLAQDMRGGLRAELASVQPRIEGARETARQALEAVDDARSRPAADTTELTAVRDSLGIPHIYADTPEDLFLAQGYVHAQDRFFQMDFWRHLSSGRLSEMFGSSQVE